jgi:two-component system OmpR family sensor kinase
MSLRRRLVAGFLAVVAVLLVADVALAATFRSFLVGRVDEQLRTFEGGRPDGGRPRPATDDPVLSEFYVARAGRDGVAVSRSRRQRVEPEPPPALVVSRAVAPDQPVRPFVVRAADGSRWRVASVRDPFRDGYRVVGANLADLDATLRRVTSVLVIATLAVVGTLVAAGVWVLRQGVRPLDAMTRTAGAIAAGDLSERVEHTDPRTEAGRLGTALNTMMGRIEAAFAARAAGEQRLRRFVADASHELRTPLTSIRGYAELYRTGALSKKRDLDDAMRRVEGEAVRMGVLVDDMLLLARLDQGRPLERAPVRLDVVAADAVADARAVDPARPVTLDADVVTVTGDDARLRQVVGNLVGNAVRHTPHGTPVRVAVRAAGGTARVEVADEGPGMDAETASRVFERFFRADPARAHGGSGLGLSIVAAVVAAHGGTVAVDTSPGHGATFVVELPLTAGSP